MDMTFKILLGIHIVSGTIALLLGPVNLIRRKGDKLHKSVGKIFAYCMYGAGLTSLILATIHPNQFLFIIGVFTLYLTLTGYRSIALSRLGYAGSVVSD